MDEKLKILEMVENKTITPAEGAELLKALNKPKEKNSLKPKKEAFKMFKVKVLSSDGDKVNIQIPIEFAKTALRSGKGFMKVDQIENLDIDFDQIIEMIEQGVDGKLVDIQSADGDIVEIVIE
jgi:hypothetical protein